MQKEESRFRPSHSWSHLLLELWHAGLLGQPKSMEKQSQSCNGAALKGREKDGGGCAVVLESRAMVPNRNRVQQPVLLHFQALRAPAYLKGQQVKKKRRCWEVAGLFQRI